MGNILLFSVIVGLVMALLLVPVTIMKNKIKRGISFLHCFIWGTFLIATVVVFVSYYLTNLDQNFTSVWIFLIVASGFGATLATGKERMAKGYCSWQVYVSGLTS